MLRTPFKPRTTEDKPTNKALGYAEPAHSERAVLETILHQWSTPGRWAKGNAAVDKFGVLVGPKSTVAVRFCAVGGVCRYANTEALKRKTLLGLATEASRLFDKSVVGVNDFLGFESIKQVIEARLAAIAAQK